MNSKGRDEDGLKMRIRLVISRRRDVAARRRGVVPAVRGPRCRTVDVGCTADRVLGRERLRDSSGADALVGNTVRTRERRRPSFRSHVDDGESYGRCSRAQEATVRAERSGRPGAHGPAISRLKCKSSEGRSGPGGRGVRPVSARLDLVFMGRQTISLDWWHRYSSASCTRANPPPPTRT
jgi:hypothetical protein